MSWDLGHLMMEERLRELDRVHLHARQLRAPRRAPLRERVARALLRPRSRRSAPGALLAIRPAAAGDRRDLARLAELDECVLPEGELLVAEVDERLVAAVPVAGGDAIVDPFVDTTGVVVLLRLRAAQLASGSRLAA